MIAPRPIWLACLSVTLTGGCIPTLHPIYTPETLVDCSGLIGKWSSTDGDQSWTFSGDSDRQCQLLYTDKQQQTGRFTVRLTRIGDDLFMDLDPQPAFAEDAAAFYKGHWRKTHTFYRIQLDGDSLSLSFINPQWLKQYLRANPEALEWEESDDGSGLVTSDTAAIREFVRTHAHTPGAFSQPVRLAKTPSD